jgi:hypothetical protein
VLALHTVRWPPGCPTCTDCWPSSPGWTHPPAAVSLVNTSAATCTVTQQCNIAAIVKCHNCSKVWFCVPPVDEHVAALIESFFVGLYGKCHHGIKVAAVVCIGHCNGHWPCGKVNKVEAPDRLQTGVAAACTRRGLCVANGRYDEHSCLCCHSNSSHIWLRAVPCACSSSTTPNCFQQASHTAMAITPSGPTPYQIGAMQAPKLK